MEKLDDNVSHDLNSLIFVVNGDQAVGKSTVLAAAAEAAQAGYALLYHTFDADSPNTCELRGAAENNIQSMMSRICLAFGNDEIKRKIIQTLKPTAASDFKSETVNILKDMMTNRKFSNSFSGPNVVCLIIDSLDKSFENTGGDSAADIFLRCFTFPWPSHIRVIVSCSSVEFVNRVLEQIGSPLPQPPASPVRQLQSATDALHPSLLQLKRLERSSLEKIVSKILSRYNKVLSPAQMDALLNNPGSNNLTWLTLACEELRVFGVFETLTRHIERLPSDVSSLVALQLNRLEAATSSYAAERDVLVRRIRDVLLLTLMSHRGLREDELRYILWFDLSPDQGSQAQSLSYADWAEVYSWTRPFLTYVGESGSNGKTRIVIRNSVIKDAIRLYYTRELSDGELTSIPLLPLRAYTLRLAQYFKKCTDIKRYYEEYPFQVLACNDKKAIFEMITEARMVGVDYTMKMRLMNAIRCQSMIIPLNNVPKPEVMCITCSMKSTFNKNRLNRLSCCLCGLCTFSTVGTIAGKANVTLSPGEKYAYKCRVHNSDAWSMVPTVLRPKCFVCKTMFDPAVQYPVLMCQACSVGRLLCSHTSSS